MVTRALVAQRAVDQDEIGRRPLLDDLPGRGHADQQPAAGGKQLLGQQHRKGGTYGAADDAEMLAPVLEFVEVGVVTRPPDRAAAPTALGERPDDIAVRVEQADLRYRRARQVFLPPRLPQ